MREKGQSQEDTVREILDSVYSEEIHKQVIERYTKRYWKRIDTARNTILKIGFLEKGWDGFNIKPINTATIAQALIFLSKIENVKGVEEAITDVYPISDLSICFLWEFKGKTIDVSIDEEDFNYYYQKSGEKTECHDNLENTEENYEMLIRDLKDMLEEN